MTLLSKMVTVSIAVLGLAVPAIAQDDRPSLTIGVQALPAGFDPGLNISNVGQRVNYSIFDELIRRSYWEGENGDGTELAPSIAIEWRNVSDLEWEVDIRTDVVFHDGTPMTAEDVAFSFGEQRVIGTAVTTCLLPAIAPFADPWVLAGLALVTGITAAGWSGVQVAEVMRMAKPDSLIDAGSGVMVTTGLGVIIGPLIFPPLIGWTGSWEGAFAALVVFPLLALPAFLSRRA